jgi:flagellar motor switch/type III secretory pathway protein FliN
VAAAVALTVGDHSEPVATGWGAIQDVPCRLSAQISVGGFKVRDLLLLQAGSVVNSRQLTGSRVGLQANGSFLAWGEFEVLNGHLAVRFTDLG